MKYTNRYGDIFTFTKDSDGNVLWEGEFKHCRFAWPNDYSKAYQAYLDLGNEITLEEFKKKAHSYEESLPTEIQLMIFSDTSKICMVDPSGGPYISAGYSLEHISEDFEGMIVEGFENIDTGYKIIIRK